MKDPSQDKAEERKPGRSFEDPSRPLGEVLLERSKLGVAPTVEDFRSRVAQAREQGVADRGGVAERAKVIGVLRKAEELMAASKHAPQSEADLERSLDVAAHDVGLTLGEYRALMEGDAEVVALEKQVLDDARRRWLRRE
jgi:hypothetical protein